MRGWLCCMENFKLFVKPFIPRITREMVNEALGTERNNGIRLFAKQSNRSASTNNLAQHIFAGIELTMYVIVVGAWWMTFRNYLRILKGRYSCKSRSLSRGTLFVATILQRVCNDFARALLVPPKPTLRYYSFPNSTNSQATRAPPMR